MRSAASRPHRKLSRTSAPYASRHSPAISANKPRSQAATENRGFPARAISNSSTRCSKDAPEYVLWGNCLGKTNTTSSTTARALSASARCATVTGLKVPGKTPSRPSLSAERRKNSMLTKVIPTEPRASSSDRQRQKPHCLPSLAENCRGVSHHSTPGPGCHPDIRRKKHDRPQKAMGCPTGKQHDGGRDGSSAPAGFHAKPLYAR